MNDSSENVEAARLRKYIGLGLSEKRQVLAWVVFAVCFALAAVYGVNWWITAMNTVYTDEGRVTAAQHAARCGVGLEIGHRRRAIRFEFAMST